MTIEATPQTLPAQAGSPSTEEFTQSAEQYRRELLAHCYRMTGSVHDAEDLVQETYLRAWRAYHSFEGRSSVRTWLYRIATNVCLTALEAQGPPAAADGSGQPGSTAGDPPDERGEVPWLEPVPDALVSRSRGGSRARDEHPARLRGGAPAPAARQRAVLILRDVLRWKAAEVAEALETTTAAVNSALQRAHAQMEKVKASEDTVGEPTPEQRALLERYVQAFWDKDIDAIVALLTQEAVWEMPPFAGWYTGAATSAGSSTPTSRAGSATCRWWPRPPTASPRSASTCATRAVTSCRSTSRSSPSTATGWRTWPRSSRPGCSRRSVCPTDSPPTTSRSDVHPHGHRRGGGAA